MKKNVGKQNIVAKFVISHNVYFAKTLSCRADCSLLSSALDSISSQDDMATVELAVAHNHTHTLTRTLFDTALVELEVGN